MENDLQVTAEKIARSVACELLSNGISIQHIWDNCNGDEALYPVAFKAYSTLRQQLQQQLIAQGLFPGYRSADEIVRTPRDVD